MTTESGPRGRDIALGLMTGIALVLAIAWLDRRPAPTPARRAPLVVIGIDGLSWSVLDSMMEAGELAAFRGLAQHGLRGEVLVLPPLSAPTIWTTFATGRFARDHGVLDHSYPFVKGDARRPVQQTERQVPALWDLASEAGLRSIVLGHAATHPAQQIVGYMVSDLAVTGATGGVHPASHTDTLLALWKQILDERPQLLASYVPWPYDPAAGEDPERARELASQITIDELMGRAAVEAALEPFDLMIVHLRMPDHASHTSWEHQDTSKPLVAAAYRQVDRLVGTLMAELDGKTNLLVLSRQHRSAGVLLGLGPDLARGSVAPLLFTDVAPTLAALLDLPALEEMPGEIATQLLSPVRREATPLPRVPSPAFEVDVTPYDFWEASLRLELRALVGEAMENLLRERTAAFDGLVQLAEEHHAGVTELLERAVGNQIELREQMLGRPLLSDAIRRDYGSRLWPGSGERDASPPPA